jgi:hypothetical protein
MELSFIFSVQQVQHLKLSSLINLAATLQLALLKNVSAR